MEKRSLRRSSAPPITCSGEKYPVLPLIAPTRLICARARVFATPKSTTLTMPSNVTITFSGVTSRWMRLSSSPVSSRTSCAACRPAHASIITWSTQPSGRSARFAFWFEKIFAIGAPSIHSMARYGRSRTSPYARMCTTFGWRMRDAVHASSRNIARASSSPRIASDSSLTATIWTVPLGRLSRAAQTAAMPPTAAGNSSS
ncbi:hypothetical protein NQZ70_03835 [Sorangium sp. Soce836]|nr:hypothetical protein NQZ70_03835 [Sorangium sp. Soce836]